MNSNHGGGLKAAALEFGLPEEEFIDFSANINPLGLPPLIKRELRSQLAAVVHYPDPECSELVEKLSNYYQIAPENLLIGNGSSELIHLISRTFASGKALIPVPTFGEYERAVRASGAQVAYFHTREADNFHLNLENLSSYLEGVSTVYLCNPNNPTGTVIAKGELLTFAKECERCRVFLVVDEAFVDFLEKPESISLFCETERFQHLIVLRSFTKAYAFPGLRLGYAAAHPEVVKQLKKLQPAWSVNTLAQRAGALALECTDYIQRTRDLIRKERDFLINELSRTDKFLPFPSQTNFILCKVKDTYIDAVQLRKLLGQQGILIREGSSFKGLDRYFFRIAVRTHRENKKLIAALRRSLAD